MNKLVLTFIISLSFFIVHEAKAQGCGGYTASGTAECLDYKGRSIDLSVCNTHTAEIGAQPTIPTATCPNTCDANNCALPPSCSTGMNSIITGTDSNNCNTFLCVSETCAPQPSCPSGTASYTGLDSNSCPEWLCSTTTTTTQPKVNCPKAKIPTNCAAGHQSYTQNGCVKYKCKYCTEGPKTCPSGKRRIVSHKNHATGCSVAVCFDQCPTPTCPAGQFVKMKSTNGGYANGYCKNYSCVAKKPTSSSGSSSSGSGSSSGGSSSSSSSSGSSSSGGSSTGTGTGSTTTSCPSTPNCGSGKTLKNNGKNSAGCTKWTCVAKSCPKAPGCSGGKTLKTTGKDSNGCTTYQCTN